MAVAVERHRADGAVAIFEVQRADLARSEGFDLAAAMLNMLGINRIRLLSNNPVKAASLTGQGIEVVELVPHSFGENPHNSRYLETKRDRQGHRL